MAEFDYAGQLLNKPQKPPEADDDFDYASAFIAGQRATSGQQAGTGEFPQLGPRPIADPRRAAGAGTTFMAGVPTDKMAAVRYFAKQRGIPESRYQIIDGDIAYQADDGKFYKEVVGALPTAAYYAPDVAEMVPDILAGVITAPLTLTGPLGVGTSATITGGTAAAANLLRQQLGGLIGGQEVNPTEVALSGGLSFLGETAPAIRKGFVERRTAKDIAQMNVPLVNSLRQKAGRLDIPLTPAEITNLASLMSIQKVITNVPESQVRMQKFYKEREKKVGKAVDDYLNSISSVKDQAQAGSMGFEALEARKQQLIEERKAATEPIYKSAFEASVPVDTSPVISKIDSFLKTQPANGRAASYLKKMKSLFEREVPALDEAGQEITKKGIENRLPVLQNIKFELDAMFNEDAFKSLDTKIQGNLAEVKNTLLEQMGKDNPDYIAANAEFERLSAPLNEFNQRVTGSSLLQMSRDNLKNFSRRIFDNPSPETVRYAKEQIIKGENGGQEAWNAVVRSYLEDAWNAARRPAKTQQGDKFDTGNTWQNILLGDQKSKAAIRTALDKDAYIALRDLAQVLEAAGRVKKLGSDTAFNQLITEELMKNPPMTSVTTGVARVVGGIKLDQPVKFISDWAIRRDASANADQIANIITSPDGMARLKELRQMSPTSARYWAGLGQLLSDYGMFETRD
jgi:hypothetical protein